jgi:hypothetical protein
MAERIEVGLAGGGTMTLEVEIDWLNAPIHEITFIRDIFDLLRSLEDNGGKVQPDRPAAPQEPSGKNAVACADCGRSFGSAHALRLHRAKSHGERSTNPKVAGRRVATDTGPFKCDDCDQEFGSKQARGAHRRSHKPAAVQPPPVLVSNGHRPATAELPPAAQPKPVFPDPAPFTTSHGRPNVGRGDEVHHVQPHTASRI